MLSLSRGCRDGFLFRDSVVSHASHSASLQALACHSGVKRLSMIVARYGGPRPTSLVLMSSQSAIPRSRSFSVESPELIPRQSSHLKEHPCTRPVRPCPTSQRRPKTTSPVMTSPQKYLRHRDYPHTCR